MDQILHILKKDIRRLRWEIAASILVTMLLAWLNGDVRLVRAVTRQEQALAGLRNMLQALSVFAWWFLIVSLIQGEAIPGGKQFWLTRPYRRGALLASKIGFVLLFLNLPTLLADAIALSRVGIPLGDQLGAMLWKQVLYSITFLLPAVALGAVTSGLAQAVLGMLGMAVIAGLAASITEHDSLAAGLRWWSLAASEVLVGLAGTAVLCGQFLWRKTGYSRGVMCVVPVLTILLLWGFSWRTAFGFQHSLAAQPGAGGDWAMEAAPEQGHMYPESRIAEADQQIGIGLPLKLRLPEGMDALSDAVEISFTSPDGTPIPVDMGGGRLTEARGLRWVNWRLDRRQFNKLAGRALRIDLKVYATVCGRERKARMRGDGPEVPLEPWGVCGARESFGYLRVSCHSAFTPKLWTRITVRDRETGKSEGPLWAGSPRYAPFHIDAGIGPLATQAAHFPLGSVDPDRLSAMDIEFSGMEPLDHVIRTVRFEGVRLEDFTVAGRR